MILRILSVVLFIGMFAWADSWFYNHATSASDMGFWMTMNVAIAGFLTWGIFIATESE